MARRRVFQPRHGAPEARRVRGGGGGLRRGAQARPPERQGAPAARRGARGLRQLPRGAGGFRIRAAAGAAQPRRASGGFAHEEHPGRGEPDSGFRLVP